MKHGGSILVLSALVSLFAAGAEVATPGAVRLQFTTRSSGAKYSPRHVLAVWVTDAQGHFVKTLMLKAQRQRSRLVVWQKDSAGNRAGLADAVSGATLRQHEAVTLDWDCRDASGALVPDGSYLIRIEFSERNGAGPVTPGGYIPLEKTSRPFAVAPPDLEYFGNLHVTYQPSTGAAAPVPRPSPPVQPATPAVPPAK